MKMIEILKKEAVKYYDKYREWPKRLIINRIEALELMKENNVKPTQYPKWLEGKEDSGSLNMTSFDSSNIDATINISIVVRQ